jgi:hypothetical protein
MKTFVLGCFFGCIITSVSFAQTLDSLWSRTFGGGNNDVCNSVQQTSDSGYIMAGTTSSIGAGSDDFWLVRTNKNGNTLWSKRFGGSDRDRCYSVQQTSDGGFILAGETYSFGAGNDDFWLVKTDANGDSVWSRTFGGTGDDCSESVRETPDGGYILAGLTFSFAVGAADFWMVKTDVNGYEVWSHSYGRNDTDYCFAVRPTMDDGYLLAGFTKSGGAGGRDFWLIKTDSDGDSLWSRTYGGPNDEECRAVFETWDGIVMAGSTTSYGSGGSDYWLVKTDSDGGMLWNYPYGGTGNEYCYSCWEAADGGYAMGGWTSSYGAGNYDFYMVKVDWEGNRQYTRTLGGSGSDGCNAIAQTFDTGYILAGATSSFGAGGNDFWLVKTGLPRPYNLTVRLNPTRTNTILRWITPEGSCIAVYSTIQKGEIGPPPNTGWDMDAYLCVGGGVTEWEDYNPIVPYKRYCVLSSHLEEPPPLVRRR